MHALAELIGENAVDQPLTRDTVLAGEGRRLNRHIEVRFAAAVGMGARVAVMTGGIVDDIEAPWRKGLRQFAANPFAINAHIHLADSVRENAHPA